MFWCSIYYPSSLRLYSTTFLNVWSNIESFTWYRGICLYARRGYQKAKILCSNLLVLKNKPFKGVNLNSTQFFDRELLYDLLRSSQHTNSNTTFTLKKNQLLKSNKCFMQTKDLSSDKVTKSTNTQWGNYELRYRFHLLRNGYSQALVMNTTRQQGRCWVRFNEKKEKKQTLSNWF